MEKEFRNGQEPAQILLHLEMGQIALIKTWDQQRSKNNAIHRIVVCSNDSAKYSQQRSFTGLKRSRFSKFGIDQKKHLIFFIRSHVLKVIFRTMLTAYMIRSWAFTFFTEVSYADANN